MTTIPGWNYDQPTEKALIDEFAKTMGPDAARNVWAVACRQLGFARPVTGLEDLIAVSDAMIELGDTVRVAGRGARIRLITYRALRGPVVAAPSNQHGSGRAHAPVSRTANPGEQR